MSKHILNPKQIEQASVRIICGDEHGSGFFFDASLIVTARHVVLDAIESGAEIRVTYPKSAGKKFSVAVAVLIAEGGEDLDIAILTIAPASGVISLSLWSNPIRYNALWETFGYPFEHAVTGNRYQGGVIKTNKIKPYDIELSNDQASSDLDYRGLSGSPLIIEQRVCGVLTWNTMDGFGAISIAKCATFLKDNRFSFKESSQPEDLPENLLDDIESAVTNEETFENISKQLTSGGKYYLLHGPPGAGKTTIAASFQFPDEQRVIAGRYFVRLPNDSRSLSYRTSREAFLEWVEDLISQKLYGTVHPKQSISTTDRLKKFQALLEDLNTFYKQQNKTAVVIIDGLDELNSLSSNGLNDFLGMFPEKLPSHLSILLSLIRSDSLPAIIQAQLTEAEQVKVSPLTISDCEYYLQSNLVDTAPEIEYADLHAIAQRSEGHALYLRYLLEILKHDRPADIAGWITSLPSIQGDISQYYEQLWLTDFKSDADKLWIALTASQLRQPITSGDLMQMLPESAQTAFVTKFPAIKHLFKINGVMSTYHSSFSVFITNKALDWVVPVNDNIRTFCFAHLLNIYSVTNIIYHTLKSSSPLAAVTHCAQEWADQCALHAVNPEFVLSDIQEVESFCIDHGLFTEQFRIKLLLQRIRFRYNQVLAENANLIAKTLLLIGRPAHAITYLVRSNVLLVSDEDALYFLRLFYEQGALLEAGRLLNAIERRYRFFYEQDKKKNAISFRTFRLMANSITLTASQDAKTAMNRVLGILDSLKRFKKEARNNSEHIEMLRESIAGYHTAFFVYHFDSYAKRAQQVTKDMPHIPPAEWAGRFALTVIAHEQFTGAGKTPQQKQVYEDMITDIEEVIDLHGYSPKDANYIWGALFEDSKRSDLISGLLKELDHTIPKKTLRLENGVDANVTNLYNIFNFHQDSGYLDEKNTFPAVNSLINPRDWEAGLLKVIENMGFCFGKAYRLRADGLTNEISTTVSVQIKKCIEVLHFSLASRSGWHRSYGLPEVIVPKLYQLIVRFFVEFNAPGLSILVDQIEAGYTGQLGLYTEGFREALHTMADVLADHQHLHATAFRLIKLLDQHVDLATQNRWERTPWLLAVATLYAEINNKEKAESLYRRMLDTSMGPTWYKEDQFALINTALSLPLARILPPAQFDKFAQQLEYAGGEMTFQRYIRHEKQEFIHSLQKAGRLADAITYFKYQVLPDPAQIISNAESSNVDVPRKGDGYVLGAHSIIEADGLISLITELHADPVLIWALTETFIINDDIYRYIDSYAKVQSQCIADLTAADRLKDKHAIVRRLTRLILAEEMQSNQHHYLESLVRYLPENEIANLKTALSGEPVNFPAAKVKKADSAAEDDDGIEDDKYDAFQFPGVGKHANLKKIPKMHREALQAITIENRQIARAILSNGLQVLHQGEADIWMGRGLAHELGDVLDLYVDLTTPAELLSGLKEQIKFHYTQDWRVANKLLKLLGNKLTAEETKTVLHTVQEHIHQMIREPEDLSHFNWASSIENSQNSPDEQISEFFIWLLNHPYEKVQERVINTACWLCEVYPPMLNSLLEHSLSQEIASSVELSAAILCKYASNHPENVWNLFQEFPDTYNRLIKVEHFMVRYHFQKMLEITRSINAIAEECYQKYLLLIPKTLPKSGEVVIDEVYLTRIESMIDQLNYLEILNGPFCNRLLDSIAETTKPLDIYGYFRADHYIQRSFFEDEDINGIADQILRNALNVAMMMRASRENLEQIADILAMPIYGGL